MTKQEFLSRLEIGIMPLPLGERESALRYYEEYIDDAGIENEAQVLSELGSPETLAREILREAAVSTGAGEHNGERNQSGGTYGGHGAPNHFPGPFRSLNVDVLNAGVKLVIGKVYSVYIDYPEGLDPPTCELIGDILHIVEKRRFRIMNIINLGVWRGGEIRITMPEGVAFERFNLSSVNGSIHVPPITLDEIKTDAVNGSVFLTGVQAKRLDAQSVNGSVTVNSCAAKYQCKCSTVNGSVKVSGEVRGVVEYSTVNGSVTAHIPLQQSEYNIHLSTVSGSIRVNGEKMRKSTSIITNAANTITASTVNGSIRLNFGGRDYD